MRGKEMWSTFLDIIFPPTEDELRVRNLTEDKLLLLLTVPHARDVHTLFSYKHDDVRSLLWQLKYKNDPRAAHLLGALLRTEVLLTIDTPTLLVPLPLSAERERKRGFNQVTSVCREALTDVPHTLFSPHVLKRVRNTIPQTTLSRYERLKNMHGAFAVPDPRSVRGKDILLIDDVVTTGATLREAKETLLKAGARSVRCVALAH